MDRLGALNAFVAVADKGGFTAAARHLRVTPSSVTRSIAQLEHALGVQLFARSTRLVRLTETGARYLKQVRRILGDLDDADRAVSDMRAHPSGQVNITAPFQFGRLHVRPLLSRYLSLYPDVSVNLRLDDDISSLVGEGIDLAVRIGVLADSALVARRVGWTRRMLLASPDYVDRHGLPATPEALLEHITAGLSTTSGLAEWRVGTPPDGVLLKLRPRFAANNVDAVLGHIIDGGGIGFLLSYQAAEAVRRGLLLEVLPELAAAPVPIHLVHLPTRLPGAATRALFDLVAAERSWDFAVV